MAILQYQFIGEISHGCDGFDGYTNVQTNDSSPLSDVTDLQERINAAFFREGAPGQLFCHRTTILPHPLRDYEAVIIATYQYDV